MKSIIFSLLFVFSLSSLAQTNSSDYIFAVVERGEEIFVYVNTKSYWEQHGALIDSYGSAEANNFIFEQMLSVDLCNAMESSFEPCKHSYSKTQYIKALTNKGFIHHIEFENFMENEF